MECEICNKKNRKKVQSKYFLFENMYNIRFFNNSLQFKWIKLLIRGKKIIKKKLSGKLNNNNQIISPYITEWNYLKGEIKNDNKYSLKNFFLLTSKGKNIIFRFWNICLSLFSRKYNRSKKLCN